MSIRSNSGCSGGQESGWTLYLGESSASTVRTQRRSGFSGGVVEEQEQVEDEEENLSMVSDASSGPPHCKSPDSCNNETEYYSSFPTSSGTYSRTRSEEKKQKEKCAKGKNGGRRSTASSLPGKSEYPNYHDSKHLTAENSASRKLGRSKGTRK